MVFSVTKSVDQMPKNGDVHHSSFKNPIPPCPRQISDRADEKPRLVLKIKLPRADNKGEKPCKVFKDRADEKPAPAPTSSSCMNGGVEEKPRLVFRIKLPTAHNKGEKSCNGVGIRHGRFRKPISLCHTKSASRVATEEKSDKKKPVPTSSTGLNCAENKACHVTSRVKLPTPNNNNLVLIPSGGMSFTDGDGKRSERRVIKIKSSSVGQNKEELLNIQKTAVQETESTEKSCLKKVQMDEEEEALELKLEATKRKLHQRYQQAQNSKRKIQVLDFKDIPKPENAPKRSRNQYRRL
jgi:hypothetical protein